MRLIKFLMITTFAAALRADVLVTPDSTLFGKVVTMTPQDVVIALKCDRRQKRTVRGSDVRTIIFDKNCRSYPGALPTAGMQPPCTTERVGVFEVTFADGRSAFAESIRLGENGLMHISFGMSGSVSGPLKDVVGISRRSVCPDLLESAPEYPSSFCFEPFRPVVNFGTEPIFNNQIFTRGFTVFIAFDGAVGKNERLQAKERVTQALRTATLIWTSLLQQNREKVSDQLRAYLGTVVARNERHQLLTAAGVVEVDCPSNAMLVVHWMVEGQRVFPRRREYLAKAQVQGRTILINARDFAYRWDLRRAAALQPGEIDLITVMAHEFGHSLGLSHAPEGTLSVMSAESPQEYPTTYDFQQLLSVLEAHVRGARPGEFNAEFCIGLRPPA